MRNNGTLLIRRSYISNYSSEPFQRMSKELFGILVIDPLNLSNEAKEYLKDKNNNGTGEVSMLKSNGS